MTVTKIVIGMRSSIAKFFRSKTITIFFCHIPKCGGSSFRHSLTDYYQDNASYYYFNPLRHRLSERLKFSLSKIKRNYFRKNAEFRTAEIVYGHFSFDDVVPRNTDISLGLFLREPIDWLGSYLHYHWNKYPGEFSQDPLKVIKKMNLNEVYSIYLGRYNITDIDFVGITEHYSQSIDNFNFLFDSKIRLFYVNKTTNRPKNYKQYFEASGILGEVEKLMETNKSIYDIGVKKFHALRQRREARLDTADA